MNCLVLGTPLYSMQVLDRVLSSGSLNTLLMLTIAIAVVHMIISLLHSTRNFAMNRIGIWFEKSLAPHIFLSNIRFSLKFKNKSSSQPLRDLNVIKSFITSNALITIMDAPWAAVFLVVLFILHPLMGFLAFISGALLIMTGIISDRITRNMMNQSNDSFLKSMKYVDQANRNADVIEVMGMHDNIIRSWDEIHSHAQNLQKETSDKQIIFAELMRFIRSSLQIAVTGLGAYLTLQGQFSAGAMIASSTLIGRALAPLEAAVNSWKNIISFRQSYDRLSELLISTQSENKITTKIPAPAGKISLQNVSWSPTPNHAAILKNINLVINPGETVVIMGNSGSGKTSLANIIVGAIQPNAGSVSIDDIKITKWNDLGKNMGYLPQEVNLFYGTVKENIARMKKNPDQSEVEKAAKIAGAHDLILQLQHGYDSQIGVSGSSISGGQRQRIALARAFYGSPNIMVLDEPNANLDKYGDAALISAIQEAKLQKKTVVIISHRLSITSVVDKIGIMQNGVLVAYDDRNTILEKFFNTANK